MESAKIEDSADVSKSASIGSGSRVWHLAQVREGAVIGSDCVIGRSSYIGTGVKIGSCCKIQNHALVYEPAVLEDGVFVGPAVVLTNDQYPRAVNPDGSVKDTSDWEPVGVTVREGAAIGARSVLVAPLIVGRWALVAAGSTVIKDVPDYALVAGTPAKQIGWVGKAGVKLDPYGESGHKLICPKTGEKFIKINETTIQEDSK